MSVNGSPLERAPAAPWLVALAAFVALALPLLGSYVYVESQNDVAYGRYVQASTEALSARLAEQLEVRLLLASSLQGELERGVVTDGEGFATRAADLQRRVPGYQAINRVDADARIVQVVPLEPNREALGRDLSSHEVVGPVIAEARATGKVAIAPPLELYQGGVGVTAYLPIHGGRKGFVNVVLRIQPLLERLTSPPFSDDLAVELHLGGKRVFPTGQQAGLRGDARSAQIPFCDGSLTLVGVPSDSLRSSFHASTTPALLGLGLAAALAAGWLAFAVQRQRVRRRAEEERLGHAERMEALATMAGGIAHDYNNLLAVMMSHLELLQERLTEPADREALDELLATCDDAAQLTRQLLTLARHPVATEVACQPDVELHKSGKLLSRLLGASQAFELQLGAPGALVRGDGGAIRQVLINLLLNARDAMPDGGTVTVSTRVERGMVCIDVRDTGVGMDATTRARAFDPFFTTKALGEGTGLGLAMVFSTVRRLGGTVEVHSEPGVGTTFELRFPLVTELTSQEAAVHRVGEGMRVLLVEDDPGLRDAYARTLKRAGLDVLVASGGEEALGLVDEHLQVLVTDVRMPGMNGVELARRVLAEWPEVSVVFCTGYADEEEMTHDGRPLGAILEKPFPLRRLVTTVRAQRGLPPG